MLDNSVIDIIEQFYLNDNRESELLNIHSSFDKEEIIEYGYPRTKIINTIKHYLIRLKICTNDPGCKYVPANNNKLHNTVCSLFNYITLEKYPKLFISDKHNYKLREVILRKLEEFDQDQNTNYLFKIWYRRITNVRI